MSITLEIEGYAYTVCFIYVHTFFTHFFTHVSHIRVAFSHIFSHIFHTVGWFFHTFFHTCVHTIWRRGTMSASFFCLRGTQHPPYDKYILRVFHTFSHILACVSHIFSHILHIFLLFFKYCSHMQTHFFTICFPHILVHFSGFIQGMHFQYYGHPNIYIYIYIYSCIYIYIYIYIYIHMAHFYTCSFLNMLFS